MVMWFEMVMLMFNEIVLLMGDFYVNLVVL